jgi:hypothetical protein
MGRYRKTRRIDAPPEAVFRAFTDPALLADWMEADGVVDQRGPLDLAGSTYTLVISGPWRFRNRVVRSTPAQHYAFDGRGPLGTTFGMTAWLTPTGTGTDLVVETEWTLPFGPVGRWMDRRWVQPGTQGEDDRELDRLVDIVTGNDDRSPRVGIRAGRRRREAALAAVRDRAEASLEPAGRAQAQRAEIDGQRAG